MNSVISTQHKSPLVSSRIVIVTILSMLGFLFFSVNGFTHNMSMSDDTTQHEPSINHASHHDTSCEECIDNDQQVKEVPDTPCHDTCNNMVAISNGALGLDYLFDTTNIIHFEDGFSSFQSPPLAKPPRSNRTYRKPKYL